MSTAHRSRIICDIKWDDFAAVGPAVQNIYDRMSTNIAQFPNCNPPMATYLVQVQDYAAAHKAVVTTHAKGAATIRIAKRDVVRTGTEMNRTYVQLLSDQSPELAGTYATESGFGIWVPGTHNRDILVATVLGNGAVTLRAAASLLPVLGTGKSRNRTYLWRHTLDGKTYINDDSTPVANTTITGLPVNTIVGFEVAVKNSVGVAAYCQTLAVFVR
jgi:hypothetical protein